MNILSIPGPDGRVLTRKFGEIDHPVSETLRLLKG